MAIEIKFDANLQYQTDAIQSVVGLFYGQEATGQGFVSTDLAIEGTLEGAHEVVFGNSLALDSETISANLRRVQDRQFRYDEVRQTTLSPELTGQAWSHDGGLDFSIEMETGTGKTYIYLRTIAELHMMYGYTKFVIVVPSIAIREGVLSNLRLMKDHLRDLYDGLQFDSYVWDSRFPTRVHQFATASHLQIMVINIDSFTKETNIFQRVDPDRLGGYSAAEWVRACRPIVIMDEPQNMETPKRREAISSLSPLFRLRYSATHKDVMNLVYRLTPVDAYDLRLVKRIGVLSVTKDADPNDAYIEVTNINTSRASVSATAKIYKATGKGTKLTQVTLRKDLDLYEESGRRSVYQGWTIEDIHVGREGHPGFVEFSNGRKVREGVGTGGETEQHQRLMIRQAVESHFEKELQLKLQQRRGVVPAAIKPLTLFFIDKVANYHPADSKFREWFEQEYEFFRSDARFRALTMPDVADVHDGYFATTRGVPKDTTFGRDTRDVEDAFERIMRNKEKLLSFEEPLRFIFSHSALVEGWDNPNVFTICNLQDGKSEMRRRQQIGRGLRLPVMDNGERCRVDAINMLTVIAHEEFSKFATELQNEIQEETGVSFAGRISNLKKDRIKLTLKEHVLTDPIFKQLWDRISRKTAYQVSFDTDSLVTEAVKRINAIEELEPIKFRMSKVHVDITAGGVGVGDLQDRGTIEVDSVRRLPDVVSELTRRVSISRSTVVRILKEIDNLDQVHVNPSAFIDHIESAINEALYKEVADGIVYKPKGDERWSTEMFKAAHQDETIAKPEFVVPVTKSLVDKVVCDSNVEVAFAQFLDQRDDVPLFLKLPHWFKIETPLGNYNPDWAFVRENSAGHPLYLVRETKGTSVLEDLQWESEGWKIKFGAAHFRAINVDYSFHSDPEVLIEPWGEFAVAPDDTQSWAGPLRET